MKKKLKLLLLFAGAALCSVFGTASHAYVVGGPQAIFQTTNGPWTWEGGAFVTPFRAALENPLYFGPAGVVNVTVDTVDVNMAGLNPFAGLDGFIVPWWRRDESAPYDAAVVNFFLGGGDLWLMQDSGTYLPPGRDGIGALLGIPTVGENEPPTPVNGIAPLFIGPFGTANNVLQGGGEEGYLSDADIAAHGGTVVGRNAVFNRPIAAFWGPGQYAPGAGALIIVADIDMFTSQAIFDPALNDNGIFALNAFAFLATQVGPIPEPGTLALLGIGLLGGFTFSRRRRS